MHSKTKTINILTAMVIVNIFFAGIIYGDEAARESGGMGYSMFGNSTIGISDLNAQLESKGYARLSDSYFSVGGGGHGIVNSKWILGGEGHTLLGEGVTSRGFESSINVTYAFFDVGYIVYSIKDFSLYPLVGIGAGGMNFNIAEEATALSLGEVLDDPQRGVELTTGGFLLNLAIGIDYLLTLGKDEEGRGGLLLGIRAGYTLSPSQGSWMMDDIEISGAPEIGITGPYIRFMFGGGAIGKKD
jgi:hypothetical protein